MMEKRTIVITAVLLALSPAMAGAADILTLQQCRDSAVANNNGLKIAEQKIRMAEYDRKIALANWFPNISATGAYMYNTRNLNLISENASDALSGLGTSARNSMQAAVGKLVSDPAMGQILQKNPELLQLVGSLSTVDIAAPLNALGNEISQAFELDIHNVFVGAVSLQQPVFMGGKIVNANKIARLSGDLAQAQYKTGHDEVISEVDNAYWQTVSIAEKKRLAEDYSALLHRMLRDTEIMEAEGTVTQADLLSVKVKANEADMLLVKASNGLVLCKMLLCRLCGLPLDSDIVLADEQAGFLPMPEIAPEKSSEDIYAGRPEVRSLEIANEIYGRKVKMARADMMPKVALTANYFVTNPNMYHGFRNSFGGMFNVGVAVNVPIIHGCEARQKVRKAKAEAVIMGYRLEDAKEKISLQVTQLRQREKEALEKLATAEDNLDSAEENLRAATLGYNEGVVPSGTLLAAQTAWVQAHSEYIDAGTELQIVAGSRRIAESGSPERTDCGVAAGADGGHLQE